LDRSSMQANIHANPKQVDELSMPPEVNRYNLANPLAS
jgi:hypothetical protein